MNETVQRVSIGSTHNYSILSAPKLLVFLSVPWSVPERVSRAAFVEAARVLAKRYPGTNVATVILDEESDATLDWIRSLHLPHLYGTCALGYDSIIWLESGNAVDCIVNPGRAGWERIVIRTLELFGPPSDGKKGNA